MASWVNGDVILVPCVRHGASLVLDGGPTGNQYSGVGDSFCPGLLSVLVQK